MNNSLEAAHRLKMRATRLENRIQLFTGRLNRHYNLRIATAAVFAASLILMAIRRELRLELPVLVLFVALFSVLVIRTRRIDRHLKSLKRLQLFIDRQERRCRGIASGRDWETAAKAAQNLPLCRDLDVVGPHSLWTLIDETLTDGGRARLLDWISRAPLEPSEVLTRQKQIQALRRERWFFTRWGLAGDAAQFRLSTSQILKFLQKSFVPERFVILLILGWTAWLLALTAIVLSGRLGWGLQSAFALGFAACNYGLLSRIDSPFMKGLGLSHHLDLLGPIFEALEKRAAQSSEIEKLAVVTRSSGPSRQARKLNLVLAFMSVQSNPLLNIIVNCMMPWSLTATHFLERRRRKIAYTFPQCIEELNELEAYASIVIFDSYQTSTYPTLLEGRHPSLSFSGLFHPLIDRSRVVGNDFAFPSGKSLGLITGSNMAGKSTFLRTVGINQLLSNMGAPVFAKSYSASPLAVETCIEVSDSLRDGYSYFYAEVRRLKHVLDRSLVDTPVLYLIDEIFRGTNNRERHAGSLAVINRLASSPSSLGFVSTHDLELTFLETKQPRLLNLHFREDFSASGEMLFSYLLHQGACPTTNALKIMAREGILVEDPG